DAGPATACRGAFGGRVGAPWPIRGGATMLVRRLAGPGAVSGAPTPVGGRVSRHHTGWDFVGPVGDDPGTR
ncbi:MAG: hypothetical protein ACYDB3_05775, partial [Acidimicrobiales bacterium]